MALQEPKIAVPLLLYRLCILTFYRMIVQTLWRLGFFHAIYTLIAVHLGQIYVTLKVALLTVFLIATTKLFANRDKALAQLEKFKSHVKMEHLATDFVMVDANTDIFEADAENVDSSGEVQPERTLLDCATAWCANFKKMILPSSQ